VDRIRERLDALLEGHDAARTRTRDPVDFVHRYTSIEDREIVGLLASSLAFGNAVAARQSIARVLDVLGDAPASLARESSVRTLEHMLSGFTHRIYRAPHVATMLARAGRLQRKYGTLGSAFAIHHRKSNGDFRESLASLADDLRGPNPDRSMRHLVSDPRAGSACKRLVLYARWMIRPADGVDLGLWPAPTSDLVIPVDTHIHRISRNLRLTTRRTASWATAEEITANLRKLDPDDPVKYDFALCHLGVSRECPSRPDFGKCSTCALQDVCAVWTRRRVRTPSAKKAG
jgi:uncharacterized protein (TIGR02757 family)